MTAFTRRLRDRAGRGMGSHPRKPARCREGTPRMSYNDFVKAQNAARTPKPAAPAAPAAPGEAPKKEG